MNYKIHFNSKIELSEEKIEVVQNKTYFLKLNLQKQSVFHLKFQIRRINHQENSLIRNLLP